MKKIILSFLVAVTFGMSGFFVKVGKFETISAAWSNPLTRTPANTATPNPTGTPTPTFTVTLTFTPTKTATPIFTATATKTLTPTNNQNSINDLITYTNAHPLATLTPIRTPSNP